MKRAYRCFAILLGLTIAVAPAALAVPAAAMTWHATMSMGTDPGNCCPGANGDHSTCAIICANALAHATLPEQIIPAVLAFPDDIWRPGPLALSDHPRPPDPPPPKSPVLS